MQFQPLALLALASTGLAQSPSVTVCNGGGGTGQCNTIPAGSAGSCISAPGTQSIRADVAVTICNKAGCGSASGVKCNTIQPTNGQFVNAAGTQSFAFVN